MFVCLCEVYVCVNIPALGPVGEVYMTACDAVLFLPLARLNRGQRPSDLSLQYSRPHSEAAHVCSGLQREMWNIGWWRFRVVKPHRHLFLMSSLIIRCDLAFDIARGGVHLQPGDGRQWELHCRFINVHESQASGNVFLLPVPHKHVSGPCVCSAFLRRCCVHYKVLEWLL